MIGTQVAMLFSEELVKVESIYPKIEDHVRILKYRESAQRWKWFFGRWNSPVGHYAQELLGAPQVHLRLP